MWRSTVITASDHLFPGLVYYDREKQFWDTGNVIKSSLPLQMALYFNVWLFPIWVFIIVLGLDAKYYDLTGLYRFLTITIYLVIVILECLRLYFGYLGNLVEKIPEMASFWLISTLLQLPLMLFILLDANMLPFVVEKASTAMMLCLLVIEIISGTLALRNIASHHLMRFYMAQVCGFADKSHSR